MHGVLKIKKALVPFRAGAFFFVVYIICYRDVIPTGISAKLEKGDDIFIVEKVVSEQCQKKH
mgnify:CR=1 FL=1